MCVWLCLFFCFFCRLDSHPHQWDTIHRPATSELFNALGCNAGANTFGARPEVDSGLPSTPGHSSVLASIAGFGLLCFDGLRDPDLRIGPGITSACCTPSLVTPSSSEGMVSQQLQSPAHRESAFPSEPPVAVTVRESAFPNEHPAYLGVNLVPARTLEPRAQ